MAQFRTVSSGGAGTQITLAFNEDLLVADGVQVYSDNSYVIDGGGLNKVFISANSALVTFGTTAIRLGTTTTGSNELTIADTASVVGTIQTEGGESTITNAGLIQSAAIGANMNGPNNQVVNTGTVSAYSIALRVWDNASIMNSGTLIATNSFSWGLVSRNGGADMTNSGTVIGNQAIYIGGGTTPSRSVLNNSGIVQGRENGVVTIDGYSHIVNSGTISSSFANSATIYAFSTSNVLTFVLDNSGDVVSAGLAYSGTANIDTITNTGTILGQINLGSNDDSYIGRSGLVEGNVYGGLGKDILIGGDEDNVLYGEDDDDRLGGRGGDDTLDAGSGNDLIRGGSGDDQILAGTGDDTVYGGRDDDDIVGDDGNDLLFGRLDDDTLNGDAGGDQIYGGYGDDDIYGGGQGDLLFGGLGDDTINGGSGGDRIYGGKGDDELTGGSSPDTFYFRRQAGDDVITDFSNGVDKIDLQAFGLVSGQYAAIVAPALSNAGGSSTFLDLSALGGSGSVLIEGLSFANADASDFIL